MKRVRVASWVLMIATLHGLLAAPAAPPEEPGLPLRLRASMRIIRVKTDARTIATRKAVADLLGLPSNSASAHGAAPVTSAMVSISIERWTRDEEAQALGELLGSKGMKGLVKALNERTLGEVHLNNELRMPIVIATTWRTGSLQGIRLALSRRLVPVDAANPFAPFDPVIDILDLTLTDGEPHGAGTLVTATEVAFDESGRIVPSVTDDGSVPQPISHVERQKPRSR